MIMLPAVKVVSLVAMLNITDNNSSESSIYTVESYDSELVVSPSLFVQLYNHSRVFFHPEVLILVNSSLHESQLIRSMGIYGSFAAIVFGSFILIFIVWSCYHCFFHPKDDKSNYDSNESTASSSRPTTTRFYRD